MKIENGVELRNRLLDWRLETGAESNHFGRIIIDSNNVVCKIIKRFVRKQIKY